MIQNKTIKIGDQNFELIGLYQDWEGEITFKQEYYDNNKVFAQNGLQGYLLKPIPKDESQEYKKAIDDQIEEDQTNEEYRKELDKEKVKWTTNLGEQLREISCKLKASENLAGEKIPSVRLNSTSDKSEQRCMCDHPESLHKIWSKSCKLDDCACGMYEPKQKEEWEEFEPKLSMDRYGDEVDLFDGNEFLFSIDLDFNCMAEKKYKLEFGKFYRKVVKK